MFMEDLMYIMECNHKKIEKAKSEKKNEIKKNEISVGKFST